MVSSDKLSGLALLVWQYDGDRRGLASKLKDARNNPAVRGQNRTGGRAGRDELLIDNLLTAKRLHLNNAVLRKVCGRLKGLLFLFIERGITGERFAHCEKRSEYRSNGNA